MSAAADLQALLRFLSQDAKVPLATAMSKVRDLQSASLDSPEKLAKVKATEIQAYFPDEKMAKGIVAAAKRVSKKRAAGEDVTPSPKKQRKADKAYAEPTTPADLEASLALPCSAADDDELISTVIFSNRAPLYMAFTVTLLKHTMPEQPLSSRLSLAQAYISTSSRDRAVSLGIQSLDKSEIAAEERLAEGQPLVTIMGRQIRVLRRWGYEWKRDVAEAEPSTQGTLKAESQEADQNASTDADTAAGASEQSEEQPPLWALDLEALRKSNRSDIMAANTQAGNNSNLPIYTPQSARSYLFRAFDAPAAGSARKVSAAEKSAMKERNLGKLLRALDMLYESWAATLAPEDLSSRTWGWYVKVRPNVEHGVAGWGGKNEIKLADILALRRVP